MNIQTLLEKIKLFEDLVGESALGRDIEAYRTAIAQPDTQNNIIHLKEIASNLLTSLKEITDKGLPEALKVLMPEGKPFTQFEHIAELESLLQDKEIDTSTLFSQLSSKLNELNSQIKNDKAQVKTLQKTFAVYVTDESRQLSEKNKAIMALVFRDLETTKNLKQFSKVLDKWNTVLRTYHQLVSSVSPKDIGLIEIQNGSFEVIIDINANVAVDLVSVFKVALQFYLAYLTYKTVKSKAIPNVFQNKRLLELEKEQEQILIDEIEAGVNRVLSEQHEERKKSDKKINKESIEKKIEMVSSAIVDHIIRDNQIKLLAAPRLNETDSDEGETEVEKSVNEMNANSVQARKLSNQLEGKDRKLLSDKYGEK